MAETPIVKNQSPTKKRLQLPRSMVVIIVVVSIISGIVGGLLGVLFINDYFSLTSDRGRQVVLEETSAIIEVVRKTSPSVVSIKTETSATDIFGRSGVQSGAGTGIVIREDGLILTNKHVVPEGTSNITVISAEGKEYTNAQVLARDPFLDLAYLKVDASGLKPAELGNSDEVVVGQKVVAIGNALGEFENSVTAGIISGTGRPVLAGDLTEAEQLQDLLQTDAAINPGNSGGPLVDMNGRVIGVNTAIAEAENIGFAIPINQAKAGITAIEESGKLSKPYLGVRYVTLTKEIAQANNLGVEEGAYLTPSQGSPAILTNSPAAKAGLKDGDIIIKVNDQSLTEDRSLTTAISSYKVGDNVKLTVVRDGKEQEINVTVEELPQN